MNQSSIHRVSFGDFTREKVTDQVAVARCGACDEEFVEDRDDFGGRHIAGESGLERAQGHCGEQRGFRQAGNIKSALDGGL